MLMKKTLTLAIALAATLSLQAQNRSDLPGLSTIISSQPEGTLLKDVNHYFEGCYVYPSDGAIYDYFADGCVADLVEADDGSLYIKNPFGFFSVDDAEVWVKAVKAADGNGYEVHLPQAVYDNQGGEDPILYAWRYVKDGSNNYAKVDANSQVVRFEQQGDSLVKVGDATAFIGLGAADGFFYGYGDTVAIYSKPAAAPSPSATATPVAYKMSYYGPGNASMTQEVSVVFEGNRVFLGGLDATQKDLWCEGTIEGNQLKLEKWQYMGVDHGNTTYGAGHMYLYPFGWGPYTDSEGNAQYGLYEIDHPALAYDAATRSFSTDELTLGVNRGRYYYPYVYYTKPSLTPVDPTLSVETAKTTGPTRVGYYDLTGRRIAKGTKGVVVRTTTDAQGHCTTVKQVVK